MRKNGSIKNGNMLLNWLSVFLRQDQFIVAEANTNSAMREFSMEINGLADGVVLNNGVEMPLVGLGVFKMTQPGEAKQATIWALEAGYRSIDTAAVYGNEEEVGRGLQKSGIPREDIFLTTKVWNSNLRSGTVREAFNESLDKLDTEYVDLYLIHWPVEDRYKDAWGVLQELHKEGRIRAIGVSNFMEEHLVDLLGSTEIVPVVNQIEHHPRLVQPKLLKYCRENDIQVEAWSPLMKGGIFHIDEISNIARRYEKSAVQIVLRWHLQNRVVTIPKTSRRDRIIANAEIFDFRLGDDDMAAIDALNTGKRIGPDPCSISF